MDEIITERSGSMLRVQLNRPTKKNAMTSSMYVTLADIFNDAAKDERVRVVLWHGAGDSFCAGNDIEDFLKNPPGPGESPQARLMDALIDFDKPIVAAVQGAAIGGGTTMLTHCDFVYAGESAKFQMPFINLALVPEFGSSFSVPARDGASPGGGIDHAGRAFRLPRGRRNWVCDSRGARPGPARDRHRNGAEAGGKTGRRAASLQAAHEADVSIDQIREAVKIENQEFSRASAFRGSQGSVLGVSRKTPAQLQQNHESGNGCIGSRERVWNENRNNENRTDRHSLAGSRHADAHQVGNVQRHWIRAPGLERQPTG